MNEILVHIGLGVIRFFIGLYELFGFLFEADFCLTNGLLSSKTLVAVRNKVRRQKTVPTPRNAAETHPLP